MDGAVAWDAGRTGERHARPPSPVFVAGGRDFDAVSSRTLIDRMVESFDK